MMKRLLVMLLLGLLTVVTAEAQEEPAAKADTDSVPSIVPMVRVSKVMDRGDSIQYVEYNYVYVYPEITFKSQRQKQAYMRLVNNVKKTLPIAKEVRMLLMETAEYLETLPNKKAKDAHMKRVEQDIVRTYKPKMKKLTYSQGKLLIKLVDRECNSTAYEAMQAFLGPVRSGMWQAFAWMFGASLKKGYDAEGADRLTERIILMVEAGQL